MAGVKALIGLAFAACIGLLFLVLACALYNDWWPLFVVVFYMLSPIPLTISRRVTNDGETSAVAEFALFITTGIVVSAFALPIVLAHASVMTGGACALTTCATIVSLLTIVAYLKVFSAEDDWQYSLW